MAGSVVSQTCLQKKGMTGRKKPSKVESREKGGRVKNFETGLICLNSCLETELVVSHQ